MSAKNYKVGYGQPPEETRFKAGQSGNPAGRKKGSKNIKTLIQEAMDETVVVNIGGKRKTISKLQAACMQQANKAAAGDHKALQLIIAMLAAGEADDLADAKPTITPQDRRALDAKLLSALRDRMTGGNDAE
jgi:hypothetical protein